MFWYLCKNLFFPFFLERSTRALPTSCLTILFLSHITSATIIFLQLFKFARHVPTSVPGTCSSSVWNALVPDIHMVSPLSVSGLYVCGTFLLMPSWTSLFKIAAPSAICDIPCDTLYSLPFFFLYNNFHYLKYSIVNIFLIHCLPLLENKFHESRGFNQCIHCYISSVYKGIYKCSVKCILNEWMNFTVK